MSNYYLRSLVIPFRMIFIMWAVFFVNAIYTFDLSVFGIIPRQPIGLIGVLAAPLLHGSLTHLVSNTLPLLFLGTTLFFFYPRIAVKVFFQIYIISGFLVWLLARPSIHIGASGLIYGLAAFLISFGIFRKDLKSLIISIIITLIYGGLIYGILPNQPGISWESHLMGGVVGVVIAMRFSKLKRVDY